jgi:hypothetical protein
LNLRFGLFEQLEGPLKLPAVPVALLKVFIDQAIQARRNPLPQVHDQVLESLALLVLALLDMADGGT